MTAELIASKATAHGATSRAVLVGSERLPNTKIISILSGIVQGDDTAPHGYDFGRIVLLIQGDKAPPYRSDTEVQT